MEQNKENSNTSFVADETVVGIGNHDKNFKIQLCREFREVQIEKGKGLRNRNVSTALTPRKIFERGSKKFTKQLDITVSMLKNVPATGNKNNPTPFVKIRLVPDDILVTTELQPGKMEAKYYETFGFSVDDIQGKSLHIQVCDKKVTRTSKVLGEVIIQLSDVTIGKTLIDWYDLNQNK